MDQKKTTQEMKDRDELIKLIWETFPVSSNYFSKLEDLERSLRYEDSDEVAMMSHFLSITWIDVTTEMLRYQGESFYYFTDIAYSKFLPSVLAGVLINYDDSHSTFLCIIRDIVDFNYRRRNIFESILTMDEINVIITIINYDPVFNEFQLYESPCGENLIAEATERLEQVIRIRSGG